MYTGVHAKENKAEEDTMDENKIKRINELYRRSKAESRAGFPHLKDVLKGKTNEPKA